VWLRRLTGAIPAGLEVGEPYATLLRGEHAKAAELWDELGGRYEAALALADSDDEALLRESLTRLDALGAAAVARRVRQRMRDLGVRSVPSGARASTREHPAGLTRREREVLELLVDGATNEQIADRLVISVKTVDHHVSSVLSKLGVPSRRVAATEAVRLGLVPAGPGT
jgi:DNA-binding NarL/FixJ family response regulator